MKLSRRLDALCDLIDNDEVIADIGCDHAQLCIKLIKSGKCKKAYACDINEGPLAQAKKNIEYYNLEDKIETCLSDGLTAVNDDVTTIVIAGMGFETIQMILNQNPEKLKIGRKFIIQANKDVEGLRKWISSHQYKIIKEVVVFEDSHYYQLIVFACEQDESLSESQIRFGKQMRKDFTFYSMWKYRLSKYEGILRSLDEHNPRYLEVMNEMRYIYEEFGS